MYAATIFNWAQRAKERFPIQRRRRDDVCLHPLSFCMILKKLTASESETAYSLFPSQGR